LPESKIENVVASAVLERRLNLESIVAALPSAEYHPERFPGVVFKLRKPRVAVLIFSSGKMVCTGAKSEVLALKAIGKTVRKIKNHGIVIVGKPTVTIQNVVASGNLHGEIDLEKVACRLKSTIYEPEQFPGLIYRMSDPKVVFLLFASGSIVCVGAKREAQVYQAVERLKMELKKRPSDLYTLS